MSIFESCYLVIDGEELDVTIEYRGEDDVVFTKSILVDGRWQSVPADLKPEDEDRAWRATFGDYSCADWRRAYSDNF